MKINKKNKTLEDLHRLEQKFEKLPKYLQFLIMLYVAVSTIVFGIVLGIMIYSSSLRTMQDIKTEKIRTEQNSINNIIRNK
jgi:hypothetical protein